MKIKEGGVMDIKKEREAFEKECRLLCYKGNMVMSNLGSFYNNEQTNWMWQMWLSSKAQAVPEGFVLVKMDDLELLRDSALEIKYASLNNDSDRIFSDIEDIQLSIERLIEAQEPAND